MLNRFPSTLGDSFGIARRENPGEPLRVSRSLFPIAVATLLAAGLVACSAPTVEPQPASSPSTSEEKPATEPAGDYTAAEWANPITNPGDLLTTITGKDFTVEVYQVGTAAATKTGQFADPKTSKPIIAVGDELVFVNYIVTNTGSSTIPLSFSLVDVSARYADWPYLQGMDSVVDFALDDQMKINRSALATGVGESPFEWKPGTSFSFGENFKYQANSPISFEAGLTPAKSDGDLDHDKKQEAEGTTTIK